MSSEFQAIAKASEEVSERIASLSPAKRALLELKLKKAMGKKLKEDKIPQRKERETAPLSFAQQRLWFLHQLNPESPHYNICTAWRLKGPLNICAFHKALNEIIGRHDTLRTTFTLSNGEPVQVITRSLILDLPVTDLGNHPTGHLETEIRRMAEEEFRRTFDLVRGPLLRCALIRLEAEEHVLLLTMHHIISDGWSMGLIFRELGTLYENHAMGSSSTLPALPVQYADYSEWQHRWFQGEVLEKQLRYWKSQLANSPPLLELPTDHPRPNSQSFKGARHTFMLSVPLVEQLKILSRTEGVTLFMILLAAFQLLLHRYTSQKEILVGAPIAGRTRSEFENLIGFFVNTLVFRADLSGNPTFRELLKHVREKALDAFEHQDLPFEKLVEELHPKRDLSYNPIIQVMFAFQNMPKTNFQLGEISVSSQEVDSGIAQFDLSIFINETKQGIQARLVYNTDLFDRPTIERMAGHYHTLLEGIKDNPDQHIGNLSILTSEERQHLLVSLNNTRKDYPRDRCLHHLLEDQASRIPENVAIQFENDALTYKELNEKANQVAHYLIKSGVGPNVLVGIMLERSLEMVIVLFGILKAGGAYMPLDPSYPKERLSFMLEDSQAAVLISHQESSENILNPKGHILNLDTSRDHLSHECRDNPKCPIIRDSLAYVIYTSGSTGKPKGVQVPHCAIVNFLHSMAREPGLTGQDILLAITTLSFDISVLEIFLPLAVGAKVVIASKDSVINGLQLQKLLAQSGATTVQATPATWQMLLESGWQGDEKLKVLCGGESLTPELAGKLVRYAGQVWNMYGPTETTVWSTCYRVKSSEKRIFIGRPIANTRIYLMDQYQQPVPFGIPGELYIGGDGVVCGYLNRNDLNAERFFPDPFSGIPDARMYRTGDLARYIPDGNIEYLGRIDYQVKIRGFRIELGEIETRLTDFEGIGDVVVLAREDVLGDKRLVAYYTVKNVSKKISAEVLRRHLSSCLPYYMLPSAYVAMERFPLTPSGKTDRKALPAPETGAFPTRAYEAPVGESEETLARIWSEVLGVGKLGRRDHFFNIGGHSLLAIRMVSRVNEAFQLKLSVRSIFEAPTIFELAEKIRLARSACGVIERIPFHGADKLKKHPPGRGILPLKNRSERYPLSYAQQRLWFMSKLDPKSSFYNIPVVWRIKGVIQIEALREALNAIVERHEALRTTFTLSDGEPIQKITPNFTLDLPVKDLRCHESDKRETSLQRIIYEETRWVFDLEQGPLLRCLLILLAEKEQVLMLTMHHIISDEWSMDIFVRELWQLYEGYATGNLAFLPELPIQYADYAVWQRKWLQGEFLKKQLCYWREKLANTPLLLELPTDRPRPVVQSFRGDRHKKIFSTALLEGLKILSQEAGTTLYMTLLASFQMLLYRYTNRDVILVGSPIAGRNRPELENLIGFFVNTIVLRTDFSGNPTFRELLKRVREDALGAYEHQNVPFEKLVEELKPERSLGYNPLVQVLFSLQNTYEKAIGGSTLSISKESVVVDTSKFDIVLIMHEAGKELHASIEYNTDLFEHMTIVRMLQHLETLLEEVVSDPDRLLSELPLLEEPEHHQIIEGWNDTDTDFPKDLCVHQIFERQVTQSPDAVAIEFGGESLSYQELDVKANQLAYFLRSKGVKKGMFVCLYMERSIDMVIGLLGILKAGGAYVPLDPSYPDERLEIMLSESKSPLLLTQEQFSKKLVSLNINLFCLDSDWSTIRTLEENCPKVESGPDDIAYIIYTSGSTGRPKGVCVPHRAINRLVINTNYIMLTASDRVAFASNTSFDAATFEIWGALLNGGCLVGVSREELLSPKRFGEKLRKKRITTSFVTTALFNQIAAEFPSAFKSLNNLLFGGEAVDPKWVRAVLQNGAPKRLLHVYGPTENTTFSTWYEVKNIAENAVTIPIGRPISNSRCYIFDNHLKPVPIGVSGELFLGGDGLAKEYHLQQELTAEKFILNPHSENEKDYLYQTGDIVRYLPDGNIEFIGRVDNQVKFRGFRIELGEIETALKSHSFVHDAVVMMREDHPGDKRLAAYIVSKPEEKVDGGTIRRLLQEQLPEYMIPFAFVFLETLPLTQNGKVDRKSLPMPNRNQIVTNQGHQAPRDALEIQLAKIWEKALGIESVGIRDNFFDLGGHSLLAIQMLSQIKKYLGKEIAVADLFKHPTVEQLAVILRSEGWESPFSLLIPFQPLGTKSPFYCIHGGAMEAANLIGLEQPFYGAFPHGYFGGRIPATVEEMAAEYVKEITRLQPEGPYFIGGYSFGGLLAFEIAHQLESQGRKVGMLALIDATPIRDSEEKQKTNNKNDQEQTKSSSIKPYLIRVGRNFAGLKANEKIGYIFKGIWGRTVGRTRIYKKRKEYICCFCLATGVRIPERLNKVYRGMTFVKAAKLYTPKKFNGRAVLFRSGKRENALQAFWQSQVCGNLEIHELPGGHFDIFESPQVEIFAEKLKASLERAQQDTRSD